MLAKLVDQPLRGLLDAPRLTKVSPLVERWLGTVRPWRMPELGRKRL